VPAAPYVFAVVQANFKNLKGGGKIVIVSAGGRRRQLYDPRSKERVLQDVDTVELQLNPGLVGRLLGPHVIITCAPTPSAQTDAPADRGGRDRMYKYTNFAYRAPHAFLGTVTDHVSAEDTCLLRVFCGGLDRLQYSIKYSPISSTNCDQNIVWCGETDVDTGGICGRMCMRKGHDHHMEKYHWDALSDATKQRKLETRKRKEVKMPADLMNKFQRKEQMTFASTYLYQCPSVEQQAFMPTAPPSESSPTSNQLGIGGPGVSLSLQMTETTPPPIVYSDSNTLSAGGSRPLAELQAYAISIQKGEGFGVGTSPSGRVCFMVEARGDTFKDIDEAYARAKSHTTHAGVDGQPVPSHKWPLAPTPAHSSHSHPPPFPALPMDGEEDDLTAPHLPAPLHDTSLFGELDTDGFFRSQLS